MCSSSTLTKCLRKATAVTEEAGNKSKRSRGKVHTDFANANKKSEGKLIERRKIRRLRRRTYWIISKSVLCAEVFQNNISQRKKFPTSLKFSSS